MSKLIIRRGLDPGAGSKFKKVKIDQVSELSEEGRKALEKIQQSRRVTEAKARITRID